MTKQIVKWLIVLAIAAALVLGGIRLIQKKKAALASIPPAKHYGVVVPVEKAVLSSIRLTLPYLAEVQSDADVKIASKVTSRVNMIVSAGTRVAKGDVLVKLDAGELQAKKSALEAKIQEVSNQIRAKRADLRGLRRTHERNRKLLDSQAISRDKFDTEEDRIASLKATIASLRNKADALWQNIREIEDTLSYTTIKSPIAGVVSKAWVAEGGITSGGKPLLSLSGGKLKRLVTRVPETIHPSLLLWRRSQCELHPLHSTSHGLDEYSCPMDIDLPAGSRVEVRLVVHTGEGILLPTNGVLEIGDRHLALLVQGKHATAKPVGIIAEGSEGFAVKGLKPGDEYVVAKPDILLKLLTGAPVIRAAN